MFTNNLETILSILNISFKLSKLHPYTKKMRLLSRIFEVKTFPSTFTWRKYKLKNIKFQLQFRDLLR